MKTYNIFYSLALVSLLTIGAFAWVDKMNLSNSNNNNNNNNSDSCDNDDDNNNNGNTNKITFTTLETGFHSGIQKAVVDIFTSADRFESFWNAHRSTRSEDPNADEFSVSDFDFTTHQIVALFRGERTQSGYGIRVTNITESPNDILMEGETYDPPTGGGMMGLMVMTQPYAIISMKKSSKPIAFRFEKKELAPPMPSYPDIYIAPNKDLTQDELKQNLMNLPQVQFVQTSRLGHMTLTMDTERVGSMSGAEVIDLLQNMEGVKFAEALSPFPEELDQGNDTEVKCDELFQQGLRPW